MQNAQRRSKSEIENTDTGKFIANQRRKKTWTDVLKLQTLLDE